MARAIFDAEVTRRGLQVTVWSAGIWDFEGEWAALDARLTCERQSTPMPKLLCTHLAKVDLSEATRVFVMERRHLDEVLAKTGLPPERVSLLGEFDPQHGGEEIEDPIGEDEAAFEVCYARLRACILHYLETTSDFN
jgi:protein-tyrosine-phosphatase